MSRDELLLQRLETARTPSEARPLLERLEQAMKAGELFGEEARIARLTRQFWEDPTTPPEVRFRLQEIYGMIAPAVTAMAPSLAETLFVHIPLGWLQAKDPEQRRWALDVLTWGWDILVEQQEVFLQALLAVLASAATWPEEDFEAVVSLLANQITLSTETHLPGSLPPAFVERLRRYTGPHLWKLPDILALDTTATGTAQLLAFAFNPPPPPPSLTVQRWRELFLEKLEGRRLTSEQKQRVVALLFDSDLREAVFRLVRAWRYRGEPFPPPLPETLPLLEEWAIQENCEEAVRLLAAAGPEGVKRLFRLVTEDRRDWNAPVRNPRPCEWDRWSALFEQAGEIAEEIEAAYRANPAPWHLRLLARAGRREPVVEALAAPDVALRREAAFVLGLAVAPEEDELARTGDAGHGRMLVASWKKRPELQSRAQRAMHRALQDPDVGVLREALRALLWRGDEAARPALLAALRMDGENQFQTFLSGFRPKLTDTLAFALTRIAREDSSGPVRRRAIELLRLGQPGSWREGVEGELRPLLGDPDPEVRRAVAGYFATVPAREVATTAALLEATQDASKYVRHFSASALGLARGWTPELVARLEARLRAGDPDDNVAGGLEGAYLHALRREPGSVDRLLAIVLDRKGPSRWRKALAGGPSADSIVARALLDRLSARPVKDWAPMPPKFSPEALERMIEFFVRAEEDPPPLVLIGHLVPRDMLDPWLVSRAFEDPDLSLEHRLWLIHQTLEIPEELREDVWQLLMQALREEEGGEMTLALLRRWGVAGVRRLVEELWDEPETLRRVARHLQRQEQLGKLRAATGNSGGPFLPKPPVEDLPWIEATLARIEPGTRDPRLGPLVELLGLWELGQIHRRAIFQTRIPQLLLRHLADPVECRAVAEAVGSLFGRGRDPRCP